MLTYCGDRFTVYVCQVIMLYTLNLFSAICPLYLNKGQNIKLNFKRKASLTRAITWAELEDIILVK